MSNAESQSLKQYDRGRDITADELEQVRSSLRGLQFGSVSIIVQDGVIVQIDRTEKHRIRNSEGTRAQLKQ